MRKEKLRLLTSLAIHNYAIIRDLEIAFHPGFNVLSGETGAGKSILVGAVNLILGARASTEMIRTGAPEAGVEAVMQLPQGYLCARLLEEWGIDCGGELVIRRSIARSGRNRVFINDQASSVQQLQQLSPLLISISGQHEHQFLLDPETHLGLLDAFANLEGDCSEVRAVYDAWRESREKLALMRRESQQRAARMDHLRLQIQELESAKLLPNEDAELQREREVLKNAAVLNQAARKAVNTLYAEKGAVLERFSEVEKELGAIQSFDPSQIGLGEYLLQARINLQELVHALRLYADRIVFDPARLAAVEERLALLGKLGKKYGATANEMLQSLGELRNMAGEGEKSSLQEEELVKKIDALRSSYLEKATALSHKRREAAQTLSAEVSSHLADLDMPRARFCASLGGESASEPLFSPTGIDRVEFLLSANPGEDLKPLARVASGGELSRVLLALKSLLGRKGEAETLIFDEVDAGIGGRVAELVAIQLSKLSLRHQVICITHLPQIACYGKHHYVVQKQAQGDQTHSSIRMLAESERTEELARMLGGVSISAKAREHAKELLQRGRKD
ncbi:MAG: DNA repair protein RecN [Syntrophobacteraceae bacterium]|nr:DNA repair protein RecN [Syntrophobacteraceae bacterium]